MENIREKIKKLLALAQSPNEHEAKAALLKAKELMFKNKLTEDDFEDRKADTLKSFECEDVTWTTDSGRIWMVKLCEVLCDNYCCNAAWRTRKGTRTHTLVITGMETDLEVCKAVVGYAVGFVEGKIEYLVRKYRNMSEKVAANSYAQGFIFGLEMAYEDQKDEHPEWGLVVVKSDELKDYENNLKSRSVKSRATEFSPLAHAVGMNDGTNFKPQNVLAQKED